MVTFINELVQHHGFSFFLITSYILDEVDGVASSIASLSKFTTLPHRLAAYLSSTG